MSASIPFVFKSAPSPQSLTDAAMPCYECSMLGYSWTCQDCSRFTAGMSMTPPSSPASDSVFPFDFTSPLETMSVNLSPPSSPQSPRVGWFSLEVAKPPTKTSRFAWSEMDYSNNENTFENLPANNSTSTGLPHNTPISECHTCSMVPYGALCTSCTRIQRSKAITLATPPAAAWPTPHTLGDWSGTKALEEELLQLLDAELFEQINVPHELDEWGRRVYNDSGHRILYYEDEDGNTVVGYQMSFCSSTVVSDCDDEDEEEPSHYDQAAAAVDNEVSSQQPLYYHDGAMCASPLPLDSFDDHDDESYEAWSPAFDTMSLAECIAELDARLRVAAWVRGTCGADVGESGDEA